MLDGALTTRSDRRAWDMCAAALVRLAEAPEVVKAKARANIELWERRQTCHPWYARRWRDLLAGPIDRLEAAVLALSDEGQALRANNPFAGAVRLPRKSPVRRAEARPVRRHELEHILRAAAGITGESEFVVVGSQASLDQFADPPPDMLISHDVYLYPYHRPELADLIDGAIGQDSLFYANFGYYADGVGPETTRLPGGWETRAVRMRNANTGGATAICPEIHDLAVAKLVAGREKDMDWVRAGVRAGLIDPAQLRGRLAETEVEAAVRTVVVGRLSVLDRR